MNLHISLGSGGYDVVVERGAMEKADKLFDLNRRVLVVTDDGVPAEYSEKIASFCKAPTVVTVAQGETSKSPETYLALLEKMLSAGFERGDAVVAVGGGVVGDLAGFVASSYMRGVDFYNVPTTLLSQIDSSIGGKTAINFKGIKNVVGAFYRPKAVLIDPDVLNTLSDRQFNSGLAEAIKMAATFDKELFELIENEDVKANIEKIIIGSLNIKKRVVELDEHESGLRQTLNFGHTIGHGIESEQGGKLYHGECVALGMIPMSVGEARERIVAVLKKVGLPTTYDGDTDAVCAAMLHDKKASGGFVNVITVDKIGKYNTEKASVDTLIKKVTETWG